MSREGAWGRRRARMVAAGVLLFAASGACYPGGVTDVAEADLVLTVVDPEADFGAVQTYLMPDTVIREPGEGGPETLEATTTEFDDAILAQVESQFSALGYRRIEDPSEGTPDAVVLLSVNTTEFTSWAPGCWYCGWGWYPWAPGWGWGWGPGYVPGYPVPIERRTVGTLLVTLLDPVAPGTTIPVHWAGAANGLLSRDSEADLARVQQAIGQMFVQSPYLAEGGEG